MRWNRAKDGDTRTIRRFAWFPYFTTGGKAYWLETVLLEQEHDGIGWLTVRVNGIDE